MNRVAVIVAGGSGTRMGKELPKQFLELNGKAILIHSINAFLHAYADIHINLVLPKEYLELAKEMVKQASISANIMFIEGGATRFESVKNGLNQGKAREPKETLRRAGRDRDAGQPGELTQPGQKRLGPQQPQNHVRRSNGAPARHPLPRTGCVEQHPLQY
ncbi:MAG: hypothetical protein RL675_806, partial [Bacteroidota bacterium]